MLRSIEFAAEQPWYERFLIGCFDNPLLMHAALSNVAARYETGAAVVVRADLAAIGAPHIDLVITRAALTGDSVE